MVVNMIKLILLLNKDLFLICIEIFFGVCICLIMVNMVIGLVGFINVLNSK